MHKRILIVIVSSLMITASLVGCNTGLFATPAPTATATSMPTNTPQPTATPTATPTVTPVPYYLNAQTWSGNLQVPILIYHRFGNDDHALSSMWVTQSVFKEQLQKLYDAGFSLISLSSWLDGTFSVPTGRKPLILTIDDGWSADQVYVNDDGTPADYSGIGILWQFVKDHPDFQFEVSINVIMGDKQFGDLRVGDWNYVGNGDSWKTKLGETIAWSIENGVEVFNHTYTHVDLSLTDPAGIKYQLSKNDEALRYFLELVNRGDLEPKLGNIIAAPQGIMPSTQASLRAMQNYINPEGKPVSAVLGAYNSNEGMLTPSIFASNFDRWNVPRVTATNYSIDWIISLKDQVPTAGECQLGPTSPEKDNDVNAVQALIQAALQTKTCPEGIYHVGNMIFTASNAGVTPYTSP